MCGIIGLIDSPWVGSLQEVLPTLASRGPDANSIVTLDAVSFGHTRLAVIDLAGGGQPMLSPDRKHLLVFNGEIYNFKALREELKTVGYSFSTESDTEVLLHGYDLWGEALPERLDGMFSYAIWDSPRRVLHAARDRFGIKPFFYSEFKGFAFASTLSPFRRLDGFPRDIDWEALRDYLAFQACLAPHSFYAKVRQLPPACRLSWSADHGVSVSPYWQIPKADSSKRTFEEVVDEIDALLLETVKGQMIADVPLGAFLSGGIDSGLMVRYMAESSGGRMRTFSMRFPQDEFDETRHALAVANEFGCEHHVLDAPEITAERFRSAIRSLDQPLADPSYVMLNALSALTRTHVTVAVSGDGGDELFGGYPRYLIQQKDFPRRPLQRQFRSAILRGALPARLLRRSLWGEERMLYRQVDVGPWPVSRKSLPRLLHRDFVARCHPEDTLARWRTLVLSFGGEMDTASLMRADLWTYLSENCLVKTDRASMAHGLEVRVPFLGNRVVDAALSLNVSTHFDSGGGKAIPRALAHRHLPKSTWNRPKHGFSVPLRELFQREWRALGDDLFSRCSELGPFLDTSVATQVWASARQGRGNVRLAYSLLVLLLWLEGQSIGS